MTHLITPAELPKWVPGKITCASDGLGWKGVALRAYHYKGQDVDIPPMRDFMIVSYRRGATHMERRFDGAWTKTHCAPGSISLLTRSQRSHWHWTENVDVSHVYLGSDLIERLANEAMERNVAEVRLRDILNVRDPVVTTAAEAIQREARQQDIGGALYVEAVATQLSLHLLRNYAEVTFKEQRDPGRLTAAQRKRIVEYIDGRLHETIDLASLADCLVLGVWSFARRFRNTFGCAPYAFVVERRIARAQQLLSQGELAIKEVAAACGFADQAHLTRTFKARLGVTPGDYRDGR